jgi:hypothetical protein
VTLVRGVREQVGLAAARRVLGLPRSTWYYWQAHRRAYAVQ